MTRQPARTPLPGPPQLHLLQPNLHHRRIIDLPRKILGKQRHGPRRCRSLLEYLDRLAPSLTLRTVNLPEIENLSLNNPSPRYPAVLDHGPVPVRFPVLLPIGKT